MNVYIDNRRLRTCSVDHSSSTEEVISLDDDADDNNSATNDNNSATNDDELDEFDANLIRLAGCNAVEELDGADQRTTADMASPKGTDGCRRAKMAKLSLRSYHSGRTNEALHSGFAKRDFKAAKVCRVEVVGTSTGTQSSSGRASKENQASIENIACTNAENKSSGKIVEQSVLNQGVSNRCQAEVALADSQTSEESNSQQKRKSAGKLRPSTSKDSSARMEPMGELFPNS